jgi:CDP-paratose 2-epimerase
MTKILITGTGGLIGSEAAKSWLEQGYHVVGIDNNSRKEFFGVTGDVSSVITGLSKNLNYNHYNTDIRSREEINQIFANELPTVIVHCAAQPSHDKAAAIPFADFDTNAVGTFNLLEATRKNVPDAVFVHMSTNKVYGDSPNHLLLEEKETRYDYAEEKYEKGIPETMSIDQCMHSLFGASKVAADICAQEYGRYFNMNVGVFRGGCLTGPQHAGVELHGFLSYIIKCAVAGNPYTIFGYKGKQVRDQIHCADVISAFEAYIQNPKPGAVYNLGGCKENSASVLEVIQILRDTHNLNLNYRLSSENRAGDHICYYSDMSKFKNDFPKWKIQHTLKSIISEMVENELNKHEGIS